MSAEPASFLPVAPVAKSKLRLVAGLAELLGSFSDAAWSKSFAPFGTDLLSPSIGTIGLDKEDSFHRGFLRCCCDAVCCGAFGLAEKGRNAGCRYPSATLSPNTAPLRYIAVQ